MQVKIALDWIPNTLHAGFFIAHHKNWYQNSGLEVVFDSPEVDWYARTPVEKLLAGKADFALAPSEYVIQDHLRGKGELVAVATLLQDDATAWATYKKGKVIAHPIYASLEIPYEQVVVEHFRHYQPRFKPLKVVSPPKLETWEMLKTGAADWCWIFLPWEGLEAAHLKLPVDVIRLSEAGIPYGYAPVLITTRRLLAQRREAFDAFLRYTAAGYFHAVDYPKEAALMLGHYVKADPVLVFKSLIEVTKVALQVDGSWGTMHLGRWQHYAQWLLEHKAIAQLPKLDNLFSNSLLVENSFLG
jgi:ABC-type nitrate/sulfonate/bicarbonate transport system substrate-binding protein